ncbi:MAG: thiolase domain-containing protein [Patescibacteria group bacterium]
MQINIAGSYITKFGELWEKSLEDLLFEAIAGAVEDSNLKPKDIDAIFVANKAGASFNNQRQINALASSYFQHKPPAMRIEGACASGGLALLSAEYALLAKRYKNVLVVGVEKMTDVSASETTQILATAADMSREYGSTFPGLYAILAQAHMKKYKTTRNKLSAVAVKNHKHAMDNPMAQFHKEFSLDQVSSSILLADPLRLLDCSPISDGAAAVILTNEVIENEKCKIIGTGHGQDSLDLAGRDSLTELVATKQAAQQALKQAGLKPEQIQAAEVHDCFTIAEILAIEDLGFTEKGKSETAKQIINPSGGLKACGHPVGATGVKQLAFMNKYLQKNNLQYGLTHNVGGSGATTVVHVIEGVLS